MILFTLFSLLIFSAKSQLEEDFESLTIKANSFRSMKEWNPISPEFCGFCTIDFQSSLKLSIGDWMTENRKFDTKYSVSPSKAGVVNVCSKKFSQNEIDNISTLIENNYCLELEMKGKSVSSHSQNGCAKGVPIGYIENQKKVIYNHFDITVILNQKGGKGYIMDSFVTPYSISNFQDASDCLKGENSSILCKPCPLDNKDIVFSYRLLKQMDSVKNETNNKREWWSILLPILSVLVPWGISFRLHKSLLSRITSTSSRAPSVPTIVRQMKEEILTTPKYSQTLIVLICTGAQLWFTILYISDILVFRVISLENTSQVVEYFLVIFLLSSIVFGYHHARLDRELRGSADALPWPVAKRKVSSKFDLMTTAKSLLKSQWMNFFFLFLTLSWEGLRFAFGSFSPVPIGIWSELLILWIGTVFPSIILGYWGSQAKSFQFLSKFKYLMIIVLLAMIGLFFGFFKLSLCLVPVLTVHGLSTRYIMKCGDRKIFITPWHISSTDSSLDSHDATNNGILMILVSVPPSICMILGLNQFYYALLHEGLTDVSFGFILFCAVCHLLSTLLCSSILVMVLMLKKDYSKLLWKSFLALSAPCAYVLVYSLIFFSSQNHQYYSSPINVLNILMTTVAVTIFVFLIGGSIGFFGCQAYLHTFFMSFGTIISGGDLISTSGAQLVSAVASLSGSSTSLS